MENEKKKQNFFKYLWGKLRDLLGFRKNSHYVRTYLNEANLKSSIYMSAIIIALEVWMIIRQTRKYIVPNWDIPEQVAKYGSHGYLIYSLLGLYFLFITVAMSMIIFSVIFLRKKNNRRSYLLNIIVGAVCVLWIFGLIPQSSLFEKFNSNLIDRFSTTTVYISITLFGLTLIGNGIYQYKKGHSNYALSVLAIIFFAFVCGAFGIKVGYSDFISKSRPKMVICFLTMMVFVACLLIWKPYISILMLTSVFIAFQKMLEYYASTGNRVLEEGDVINYITFLISLAMVAVSIYQQRIGEAKKDEHLIRDATFDPILPIYNVRHMSNLIQEKLNARKNYFDDKIFLFINLFNFKTVNFQKGFEAGNLFLEKFNQACLNTFKGDLVSRQTDDHFVVLARQSTYQERINELDLKVKELADGMFVLLKVGGYRPTSQDSVRFAIDKARYASTKIKRVEQNFKEYDKEMDEKFDRRQYIVNHLEEAIENDWIKAYYQPVVWSNTKELCGAEALARWIDPKYGFLSPADFIPVLEESRLIHKLDAKIIQLVCSYLRNAIDNNRPIVPISINFSRLDFELMNVIEVLEENISKYNIDKKYIHVEVTESAISGDTKFLNNVIGALKDKGYAIWLDDFGSGYSSLNVLKDFMFDVIKIDMQFLSNFENNASTKDILDAIVRLANRLGMKTLTEGVETLNEADFLQSIGCGRLQGYLFGKPFALEEFERKIQEEFKISPNIL